MTNDDLDLIRQFMAEFLPSEAQLVIHEVFSSLKQEPFKILNNSLMYSHFNYFSNKDTMLATAASNGMILGFALAVSLVRYPETKALLTQYLDTAKKNRGENIINFLDRRR